MELKHQVFKKHPNRYFVETGTYAGDGVQAALESGFENIISLEVFDHCFNISSKRFEGVSAVQILKLDSALFLYDVIKDINEPITFWLDGHYSGEGTSYGLVKAPVLYELHQIRKHHLKSHTILIDDVRAWRGVTHDREFELEDIINSLLSINSAYHISYADGTEKNDVLIASLWM